MKAVINKKIMILILTSVFIAGCGKKESPVSVSEVEGSSFFKVQLILGDVKIAGASGERGAKAGEQVNISETVVTGKKSIVNIVFGKSGVIRINENSSVVIKSIADKLNNDTVIDMNKGKVYVTLSKLKGKGFKVKTPTVVASVRGTSFTVVSDKKGSKLSVLKGTVAVNPVKDGQIIEDKTVSVETGNKTGYIDEKSVEKIIMGKMEIPVTGMTPAEKIQMQSEVKDIKIEEIPDLSLDLKEEVKQQLSVPDVNIPAKKEAQHDSSVNKENKEELHNQIEEEMKIREEEQNKIKRERLRKDKASNIPVL